MDIIINYGPYLLISGCVFGFFMAWGIGANDVANAMGTSVGAKALTLSQAILVACIFEFAGAYLAGGEVTSTIRKGIIDPSLLANTPELLVFGMLASLLAAGSWLLIASYNGWPVSTTHSIVGAIVGFAAVGISVDAVSWGKVTSIVVTHEMKTVRDVSDRVIMLHNGKIQFNGSTEDLFSSTDPIVMAFLNGDSTYKG